MKPRRVLIADDEPLGREFLEEALRREGYEVHGFGDGRSAVEGFPSICPDLVLTDLRMPGCDGLELLREVKKASPETPVVLLTAYGSLDLAITALREGASDLLLKPFQLDELQDVLRRVDTERFADPCWQDPETNIIGADPHFREVLAVASRAAETKATVLIQGESGTGKELVARLIHSSGPRKEGPMVKVNCACLSASLLESELFGHEKGAFTGALRSHKGRFELADGGTLMLDEIGEFPIELQPKILRVLEVEEFERVGGTETIGVDVHVIGVTNRDLRHEVREKRFRDDLFFRLNVVPLFIPPLRERAQDIPLLVNHFVTGLWTRAGRRLPEVPSGVMKMLCEASWPGNVRELENFVHRLLVLNRSSTIDPKLVRELLLHSQDVLVPSKPKLEGVNTVNESAMTLKEMEKRAIFEALEKTGGNRTQSAKLLGVSTRTLFNKLRVYEREGELRS